MKRYQDTCKPDQQIDESNSKCDWLIYILQMIEDAGAS